MNSNSKPYDPKLREAAAEFTQLCLKYDCIGVVLFVSPTHAEFVHNLSPTWSALKMEGENLRFRAKKEDFKSKEQQDFCIGSTVHAVTSLFEWSRLLHNNMFLLLEKLKKQMEISWEAWDRPDSVPGDGK